MAMSVQTRLSQVCQLALPNGPNNYVVRLDLHQRVSLVKVPVPVAHPEPAAGPVLHGREASRIDHLVAIAFGRVKVIMMAFLLLD